jgi:hypothetical protein
MHSAEISIVCVALAGDTAEVKSLQLADIVSPPPMALGDDLVHIQGPLMLMGAAELAAALYSRRYLVSHRADDRAAVAEAVRKHLLTPLVAEFIQPLAAQLARVQREVWATSAPRWLGC